MGEIIDETQVGQWLGKNGISERHQQFMLKHDRLARECREKIREPVISTWRVGNMEYTSTGRVLCGEALNTSIGLVLEGDEDRVKALCDFKEVRKEISAELDLAAFARLIKPIAVGDDYRSFLVRMMGEVSSGKLEVEYFPWQNPYIVFLQTIPEFNNDKERRRYYWELPWEYCERAIINTDGLKRLGDATPLGFPFHPAECLEVWQSYLPPTPTSSPPTPPPKKTNPKGNANDQKAKIMQEITYQGLDPMNIALKTFKSAFLKKYPQITTRQFDKVWWELSGSRMVCSDKNTLKAKR